MIRMTFHPQEPCCQHTYYRARWLLPTPKIDVKNCDDDAFDEGFFVSRSGKHLSLSVFEAAKDNWCAVDSIIIMRKLLMMPLHDDDDDADIWWWWQFQFKFCIHTHFNHSCIHLKSIIMLTFSPMCSAHSCVTGSVGRPLWQWLLCSSSTPSLELVRESRPFKSC